MTLDKFSLDEGLGSSGSSSVVNQLNKTVSGATIQQPYGAAITIPNTSTFAMKAIQVLRFIASTTNLITTIFSYNNGESSNFNGDSLVIFDGTMRLAKTQTFLMTDNGALSGGFMQSFTIDRTKYVKIESIGVV